MAVPVHAAIHVADLDRHAGSSLPVPMSTMSIEQLMTILPTLDAAIIALDWIPNMQARQAELKMWLQDKAVESLKVNTEIRNTLDIILNNDDCTDGYVNVNRPSDMSADSIVRMKGDVTDLRNELASLGEQHERTKSMLLHSDIVREKTHQTHDTEMARMTAVVQAALDALTKILKIENLTSSTVSISAHDCNDFGLAIQKLCDALARNRDDIQVSTLIADRKDLRALACEQQDIISDQSRQLDRLHAYLEQAVNALKSKDKLISVLGGCAELQSCSSQTVKTLLDVRSVLNNDEPVRQVKCSPDDEIDKSSVLAENRVKTRSRRLRHLLNVQHRHSKNLGEDKSADGAKSYPERTPGHIKPKPSGTQSVLRDVHNVTYSPSADPPPCIQVATAVAVKSRVRPPHYIHKLPNNIFRQPSNAGTDTALVREVAIPPKYSKPDTGAQGSICRKRNMTVRHDHHGTCEPTQMAELSAYETTVYRSRRLSGIREVSEGEPVKRRSTIVSSVEHALRQRPSGQDGSRGLLLHD